MCGVDGRSRQSCGQVICPLFQPMEMRESLNRLDAHSIEEHVARPVAPNEKAAPRLLRAVGVDRPVKERYDVCGRPVRVHVKEKVCLTGEGDTPQQAVRSLISEKSFVPRALSRRNTFRMICGEPRAQYLQPRQRDLSCRVADRTRQPVDVSVSMNTGFKITGR